MKHIKKIIENELKNLIEDDRMLFRKTSLKTFEFLVSDLEKRIEDFESKILDSAISQESTISIINMIVPKNDFYLYEENFSPIILSDVIERPLIEILNSEDKVYKKIILDIDRENIETISNLTFDGVGKLNGIDYSFIFKLEKDDSYDRKIKEIYDVFGLNGLKWRTLNTPYLYKAFKVVIVEFKEELLEELKKTDEVLNIDIDKKGFEKNWVEDHLILWNVIHINMLGNGEINPTKDRIHYEHTLFFNNNNNVYLCPDKEIYIYYIQRILNGFRIITDENREMKWEFIKIAEADEKVYEKKLNYPVFSNRINPSFINKIKMENDIRLRNLGEIKRIVNSFDDITKRMELVRAEITDEEKRYISTNDSNPFVIDEFKLKGKNSNMYFYFKIIKKDFYIKEILDFIISELQLYFPEYDCKGVLV
ncbi:hypothetical protein [Fusobacterium ulcerans]|uniref:Normocyte-binding protein n=1 Tax=Fusobacterium ulcerans 12-1B TaxID=457404 RepID=H1PSQ8_9FUSO|nr:hypothetical protein [Fusobacterium ulcerans]EHO81787.1 hypothetical protein HMPREF0402_01451 [Fusobacterium ulcerans 12-1B]